MRKDDKYSLKKKRDFHKKRKEYYDKKLDAIIKKEKLIGFKQFD